MAFKMKGWSPFNKEFNKDLFEGKSTKAKDKAAYEEEKKKWNKQYVDYLERIKKHNEGVVAPWEKWDDELGKPVPRFRGKSISKTSKTKAK